MVSRNTRKAGWLASLVMIVSSWAAVVCAEARVTPTASDLRVAAERFDEGRNAFKAGAFTEAAEAFEAADARAPSASALGLAMRSRFEAGQSARAATLAELVLTRHPDEFELVERAKAIVESAARDGGRVRVQCTPACDLVVDDKLMHGRAAEQWSLHLEPGSHVLAANWSHAAAAHDQVATEQLTIDAGDERSIVLQPHELAVADRTEKTRLDPMLAVDSTTTIDMAPAKAHGLPPFVFWIGVGTTVAVGGAAIWSGFDTLHSPGPDAVRQGCVGLGDSCKLYRQGQLNELRTNVLIGTTAVLAVATAVTGLFFTNFAGEQETHRVGSGRTRLQPWVSWIRQGPNAGGTILGAEGRF